MRRECRERFPLHRLQRKPLVSDPGMHHGTCVTHVPLCMSESLTRGAGVNVPGIPGACATNNFTYLARGPFRSYKNTRMVFRLIPHPYRSVWHYAMSKTTVCQLPSQRTRFWNKKVMRPLWYAEDLSRVLKLFHNTRRASRNMFQEPGNSQVVYVWEHVWFTICLAN